MSGSELTNQIEVGCVVAAAANWIVSQRTHCHSSV